MRRLIGVITALSLFVGSCTLSMPIKPFPEHKGVDQRIQKIVDEYKWLSMQKQITFKNSVSIGFKKIDRGNVIGLCTYGPGWREIDVDIEFWLNNGNSEKLALLFHELTHCYCGRSHDWADGREYPATLQGRIDEAVEWSKKGGQRPGRFDDGCPSSLMYPIIVDERCFKTHYSHYVNEMFDRCNAW